MTVLVLRLAGPMQSWGDSSRFTRRDTRMMPTKSGVLGLLAAAQGRRRTDPIEDLAGLRFGVRVDQPGSLMKDFQTAIDWTTGESMPLSDRYYVADAAFVAAVEGDSGLLESLADAISRPRFGLYLGRRSCPVTDPVLLGVADGELPDVLAAQPWQAARWYRNRQPRTVHLPVHVDASPGLAGPSETRRDVPESFDPVRREYGWREVVQLADVEMDNPDGWAPASSSETSDWFATVKGA